MIRTVGSGEGRLLTVRWRDLVHDMVGRSRMFVKRDGTSAEKPPSLLWNVFSPGA